MKTFINYTNHPTCRWSKAQLDAAKSISDVIVDIPFPSISPYISASEIYSIAAEQAENIVRLYPQETIVHISGEFTFVVAFVSYMQKYYSHKITCITSTSERNITENPDGTKTVKFDFVQFRAYITQQ